ncbi:unnamed protein product [Clonostachys solani]|uniref:Uncharacterized protein n=1 Tax=Clonostachys solani TaxID=160281 RepID=A0A9N9W6P7_9HYPO|nr:unnamed protein product [Clonostachys solani]
MSFLTSPERGCTGHPTRIQCGPDRTTSKDGYFVQSKGGERDNDISSCETSKWEDSSGLPMEENQTLSAREADDLERSKSQVWQADATRRILRSRHKLSITVSTTLPATSSYN